MAFDSDIPTAPLVSLLYRNQNKFLNKKLKDVELSSGLYPLLIKSYKNDGISQEELASSLHVNESTITRNLDKLEVFLDLVGQAEQSQVVGDGGPFLSHAQGHGFLGEFAFVDQPLETERRLDGVEVFALDVLHDGHFEHGGVIGLPDVGRDVLQARLQGGAVAAFAADDLVALRAGLPQGERLDDSERADGVGQLRQRLRIEVQAGLEGVGDNLVERNLTNGGGIARSQPADLPAFGKGCAIAQQGAEAAA